MKHTEYNDDATVTLQQETSLYDYAIQVEINKEIGCDATDDFWDWYSEWCSENGVSNDQESHQDQHPGDVSHFLPENFDVIEYLDQQHKALNPEEYAVKQELIKNKIKELDMTNMMKGFLMLNTCKNDLEKRQIDRLENEALERMINEKCNCGYELFLSQKETKKDEWISTAVQHQELYNGDWVDKDIIEEAILNNLTKNDRDELEVWEGCSLDYLKETIDAYYKNGYKNFVFREVIRKERLYKQSEGEIYYDILDPRVDTINFHLFDSYEQEDSLIEYAKYIVSLDYVNYRKSFQIGIHHDMDFLTWYNEWHELILKKDRTDKEHFEYEREELYHDDIGDVVSLLPDDFDVVSYFNQEGHLFFEKHVASDVMENEKSAFISMYCMDVYRERNS